MGGVIWNRQHSTPASLPEKANPTPKPSGTTHANPNSTPPNNSEDSLLNAIRDQDSLKAALESLIADVTFGTEGNLIRLGLDSLPITDDALSVIAKKTHLRALYLCDTKISDAGLTQLERLKELKFLMLTGSLVSSAGADALQMALPNCVILF